MELSKIKNMIDDTNTKLTDLTDKINAGLVDDNFSVDDMQKLKDSRDAEKARLNELKSQRDAAEAAEVTANITTNSKNIEKGAKTVKPTNQLEDQKAAINDYLHSKGTIKDAGAMQVTSTEDPLIPEEIVYNPESEVNTVQDLKQYVSVTPVTTASGTYPVLARADDNFNSVAELKENPALDEPTFKDVSWKVQTYRGAIPLSQEAIDDTQVDLTSIVAKNMQEKSVNTTNAAISAKLVAFSAVASADANLVDTLKGILNVKLDPAYMPTIVASASFYNKLDTLKDNNGQYIFHQDITSASQGVLLGVRVVKVRDELLGKAGEEHAFIGDLSRAILFADRKEVSLSWADDKIFGQYLMGALRFDVEVADAEAGYFLTNTAGSTSSK
ncbi:phage major capsid protein [Lentilactobacillus kosonis]|uniref:Phage capsid protein n=1 Tax=Lentilactobacillus kosonis TaxID=2810561 RepID=A0A401FPW2_9LACO|nr:phage major capsid protein [Lentilactobacillus kosonis]GAY74346.1 phage capsid protein [Lentilactobacillus kosonis]